MNTGVGERVAGGIENRFQSLLESAPDATVIVDEDGLIVIVNAQTERLFGYKREELLGEKVEMLIPERLRGGHPGRRSGFVADPKARPMGTGLALDALHKDGTEFPVEISLGPLDTDEGLLVSAAIRDLSDRRRAERRFRALLEAAPDAIVIVDETGTIMLVNAQTEQVFGWNREELIGQPVEVLVPGATRDGHAARRDGFMGDARVRPMGIGLELKAVRKDGSEFPVEISLSPLETDEGLLVSASVRDVTERKQLEEETNRLQDEFFSVVSHELRTPLASILGYVELLQEQDELSETGEGWLRVIKRNAERESRLVRDLLLLVRVDGSGFRVEFGPVDLSEIATSVVESTRPMAEAKQIALNDEIGDVPVIDGDPQRLEQVVDNLLVNAIKFTPEGGTVEIRAFGEEEEVLIEVVDSGIGIAEEERGQLFDRLFRATNARELNVPGLGLGLTIVKAITEVHGGSIEVESDLGEGTTMRVRLPIGTPGKPRDPVALGIPE